MSKTVFKFPVRTTLRLCQIEQTIREHRIVVPCPSRQTLIGMCEDGTFETVGTKPTSLGYLVFEDSFIQWVYNLQNLAMPIAA